MSRTLQDDGFKRIGGRREDARLLRGQGRFWADCLPEGTLHAVFVRADRPSLRLVSVDVSVARAMPGVVLVLTGAEMAAAGIGPIPSDPLPRDDGAERLRRDMPVLASDCVRHQGEPLVVVVARSLNVALDAAEAVVVDAEELPPDTTVAALRRINDIDAVAQVLATSAHCITASIEVPRVVAAPLECRGCVVMPDGQGGLSIRTSTQNPFAVRRGLAAMLRRPEDCIRVIAEDVGGSFGLKGFVTREDVAVAHCALVLGQPVAWSATRSESFLADHQGRGVMGKVQLGLDANHRFTAVLAEFEVDLGAYPDRRGFGISNNAAGITGLYSIPHAAALVTGRLSALMPSAPYRGNGRPEATLAIETAIDAAARQIGLDPVDLRKINLIAAEEIPYVSAMGFSFDSGDFEAVLSRACSLADRSGLPARRSEALARGRILGAGFVLCVESAGGPVGGPRPDHARIVLDTKGGITLAAGVMSSGQGHETALIRMAAARLDLPDDRFSYRNGDTTATVGGRGSGGSAGMTVAGSAMLDALDKVLSDGAAATAAHFAVPKDRIEYSEGRFAIRGANLSLTLAEVAGLLGGDSDWVVDGRFTPDAAVFPNGAHVCEVEVDPETGDLLITRYHAVEDVGRVHNPDLVEGQLHGGIAMGLAQVLGERVVTDAYGQTLTGSFMDYYVARAADLPYFDTDMIEVATRLNPLGVKGVGEAGTVGATAALMSALNDALARAAGPERPVPPAPLPATPSRLWQAFKKARAG